MEKKIRDVKEVGVVKETAIFNLVPEMKHQYAENFSIVDVWNKSHSYKSHISTGDYAVLWNGESEKSLKEIYGFIGKLLKEKKTATNNTKLCLQKKVKS